MYEAHVHKLLPGGPCEDYVYRFKVLGRYESRFDTKEQADAWWRNCVDGIEGGASRWPHDFTDRGWSGWHPESGVGVRLVPCGAQAAGALKEEIGWWQLKTIVTHGACLTG